MSTSNDDANDCKDDCKNVTYKKGMIIYIFVSVFCFLFGLIYELAFAHDIQSLCMWLFFLVPLFLGTPVVATFTFVQKLKRPGRLVINMYNGGVAGLTIGIMMQGVFEIAYTDSPTGIILAVLSVAAVLASVILYFRQSK